MEQDEERKTKNDEEFGEFLLNERFNWFEGKINWQGKECKVIINCFKDINDFEIGLDILKQMYHNMNVFYQKCMDYISEKLLKTAIEWNDGVPISKKDFISNTILESISINRNISYELRFSCGDTFKGHIICVRSKADGQLKEAIIEG